MAERNAAALDHRQLGIDLFNHVWTLLEKPKRTREEDEAMVHAAHASAHHWRTAPECQPENRARSEWQVSRVYAVLRRAEPALHHARRCLELCEEHDLADWDLAFAYEALARAWHVAGDAAAAEVHIALARAVPVAEAEDRDHLEQSLATIERSAPELQLASLRRLPQAGGPPYSYSACSAYLPLASQARPFAATRKAVDMPSSLRVDVKPVGLSR